MHTYAGRGRVSIPVEDGSYLFKGTIIQREGVEIVQDGYPTAMPTTKSMLIHLPDVPGAHFFVLGFIESPDGYHCPGVSLKGLQLVGTPGLSGDAIHWVGPMNWEILACRIWIGFQDGYHLEGSLFGKIDGHTVAEYCVTPL